jgi:hypothetical protein
LNKLWRPYGRALALCLLLAAVPAAAQPGDAAAVAQARADYARAMRGHDVGLQNAMRAELEAQLAMHRERAARQGPSAKAHHTRRPNSAR